MRRISRARNAHTRPFAFPLERQQRTVGVQAAARPGSWAELSDRLKALLRAEGIVTPRQWRAAGRRRHRIFGIVPHVVRELDALARGLRP